MSGPPLNIKEGPCPTCGGSMSWRQNRVTQKWFQGCDAFPACRGTRDVTGVSTVISAEKQNRMWTLLKAAVLASDDECLTFTQKEIDRAQLCELHIDEITGEQAYIVTVKERA